MKRSPVTPAQEARFARKVAALWTRGPLPPSLREVCAWVLLMAPEHRAAKHLPLAVVAALRFAAPAPGERRVSPSIAPYVSDLRNVASLALSLRRVIRRSAS